MRIQIGPHRYRVIVDEAAIDRHSVVAQVELLGHCSIRNQTITIRPGLPADQEADTVLHEVLHAVLSMIGASGDDAEEGLVARLAPALLDVLRRNPELVDQLVSG